MRAHTPIHATLQSSGPVWHKQDNIYRMVARSRAVNLKQWLCLCIGCTIGRLLCPSIFVSKSLCNIQMYTKKNHNQNCTEEEMGGVRGRGGGTATIAWKHDRTIRSAGHACINTPLLLCYILSPHSFHIIFILSIATIALCKLLLSQCMQNKPTVVNF